MTDEPMDRKTRMVLGFLLLSTFMAGLAMIWSSSATVNDETHDPDTALSAQILVFAALSVVATIVLAIRYFGVADGLKMIATEAWPGLLVGFGGAMTIGFALRVLVPASTFWIALLPIYVVGALGVRWFADRGPGGDHFSY